MDGGGNSGLTVSSLRCFRGRSAGIDLVSDNVGLNGILVDLVAGGTTTTTEIPGGIGMHLSGNVRVKDSRVRRAAHIGILADGPLNPNGNHLGVQIDGNLATSRVEASTGIGIQLDGASHQVNNTYVAGDGATGVSTIGVLINGTGVSVDGSDIVNFGDNGFLVNGSNATIKRSTVEGRGDLRHRHERGLHTWSGNSASRGQKGLWSAAPMLSWTPTSRRTSWATAFEVSGAGAVMTGNIAKAGKANGYVLSGIGGTTTRTRPRRTSAPGSPSAGGTAPSEQLL
jgi:hypothetical protein